jgi:hypothetical protein
VGVVVALALGIIVVALVLNFTLQTTEDPATAGCYFCSGPKQSQLGDICSPAEQGEYGQYAISTDSNVCANAGR